MITRIRHSRQTDDDNGAKWFNSPVVSHSCSLEQARNHIPDFERRAFSLTQPRQERSRLNERLDMIVRLPFGDDRTFIPVGVVSKQYTLVPHTAVLDVAAKALDDAKIVPADVKAEIAITEYGERMALSLYLPCKYSFDPGDGHSMALRLECFNSVDGSTRFRVLIGWFRFVCRNGLIMGVTRSDLRQRHVGDIRLEDIGAVVVSGLKQSETEKGNFEHWRKTEVTRERLELWVDKDVREGLGFKAAARAFHIACSGFDADVVGQYKSSTPTCVAMQQTMRVPGAPLECENLFDLSQILAWLARERRDLQEQLEWRERIPELMQPLMRH